MKKIVVAVASLVCGVLLVGGAVTSSPSQAATVGALDLPALARDSIADLEAIRMQTCPDLPLIRIVAEVQAESSWYPRAYSSVGAAGLLQMMPGTWTEAGGGAGWDTATGPDDDHPVWSVQRHFEVALPWMCNNLADMTQHLRQTGKTISPLDALAVCHIAGCSRVTQSTEGIPRTGEAGCGADCVAQIHDYLDAIDHWTEEYTATPAVSVAAAAQAFSGASTGCTVSDPTGTGGCVTSATAWMLSQFTATFGKRSMSCWDAHAWNPKSDHPQGRGCDIFYGKAGTFPGPEDTALGWQAATWLQANADALHISYLIWQGRIWSVARDDEGWRAYTGGGVYDAEDPTGGHYDHIHVSVAT